MLSIAYLKSVVLTFVVSISAWSVFKYKAVSTAAWFAFNPNDGSRENVPEMTQLEGFL